MKIHKTSIIDSTADIHDSVEIGPFCIIGKNVKIGPNSILHANVQILDCSIIGENNIIHQGAIIGGDPQDLKFEGEKTHVEIGNNNVIREYCTINRGTKYHGKTVVGNNCLLMAYVHLANDCIVGDKVILANAVQVAGHVTIGYHVTIGGITGIHQFCKVGDHSFVGACRVILRDIPPYILATGDPLKYSGINTVGLRRRGFDSELRHSIKEAYKTLYLSNYNISQAVKVIKGKNPSDEIKSILKFIEHSERGII